VILFLYYYSPSNVNNVSLAVATPSRVLSVNITSITNVIFRETMLILVALVILIMFWFGGVAVAQEDKLAVKRLKADKLYNMAKIMQEGKFLVIKKLNQELKFKKARYVIQSKEEEHGYVPLD
jgi:hypothetical protein